MAANPVTLLSIDEYLRTTYRPDCDFVDGEIEERNVGERDHNRIQLLVAAWFLSHEREWNIESIPEQRTRVSKNRFASLTSASSVATFRSNRSPSHRPFFA